MEVSSPGPEEEEAPVNPDDRYRSLVESGPYPLFVDVGGRIVFANRAFSRMMGGADPGDFIGRSPLEWVPAGAREELAAFLEQGRSRAEGQAFAVETVAWRPVNGSLLEVEAVAGPVDWTGHTGVQVTLREIHARRQLEHSLFETEKHLRTVTERVERFAVFSLDRRGHVDSWNPGAVRLFDYAGEEILGQHFRILFTPEDQAAGAPEWELSQASETGLAQDERWHQRKDGSRFFVSGLLVAVLDERGAASGFTKVAQDNTQRKSAEEALRESEARYRELAAEMEKRVEERTRHLEQSIQSWESFCYSIAHDLRAPLRSISGFAGALLDDYGGTLDPTGQTYAERMLAAANRLDEFIQDLLDFGRLAHAELPPAEVDLNRCLQQVFSLLAEEISSSQAEIQLQRPLPSVWGNVAALHQVLTNLLSNAIKFVAPGSTPRVEIRAEERNGLIRLWFQDHGIGISPAHQDRIFELFERLHPHSVYPGTGVGLAIVRIAMQRMGGRVGLQSEAGEGTAFWIELPAVGGNGPLTAPAQSSSGGTLP